MKTAKNYYTYRIRVAHEEVVQVEKFNPQHESMGEPDGKLQYKEKRREILQLLQIVSNNELNSSNQARILGETLFDVFFDKTLRQDFVSFYFHVVHKEKQFLRVELDIDEQKMPELAALPWEFMYLPASPNSGEIWLSTDPNLVFSRRRAQWNPAPPIQLEPGEKLRIALAIAAPQDLGEVEYKTVQTALETLAKEQSERIELLPIVNPATPKDIDSLLEKQPHIFHFIGHGRLQDEDGKEVGQIALVKKVFNTANWVDASFFGGLFTRPRLGIVFLQACEGGMLSESEAFVGVASKIVQQNIPVVVAMQYKVSNFTAIHFAYEFYKQLAQDYPVDIAAQNARHTIALDHQYRKRDFATPVIFMRVQDGYLFRHQDEVQSNVEIVNRVATLKQLYQDSRARCIVSWRAAQVPQEEAEKLVDDLSIGSPPPDLQLLPGKLIILTGEMGAGKSLIAERLFQKTVNQAIEDHNYPIPVFLHLKSELSEQKQINIREFVENAAKSLGNPKTQGAIIFIDGADERISLASELLDQARLIVNSWTKTTVIITSRPLPIFDNSKETIFPVPKLSKDEAYALIEKFAKQPITYTVSKWPQSLQNAIHIPLFAILLGIYLGEQNMRTPRSTGELLSYLFERERSLGQETADIGSANQLLQKLAIKCVEYGGSLVHHTEIVASRTELQPILNSRLVFERFGKIGFPLAILTEWFAAQSLATGNPDPQVLARDSEQLGLWRYPLIMAIANFGHDQVSKLLTPLIEQHPAFAAELVNEALANRFIDPDMLPWRVCGQRIREAMQAWVAGLDKPTEHSLAKLIAPVQNDGKVKPVGINLGDRTFTIGFYDGDNFLENVVELPNSQVFSLPGWRIRRIERSFSQTCNFPQIGIQPAWAWRWALNELVSSLSKLLQHRAIPVNEGILAHEALWQLARSILGVSKNTSLRYSNPHHPINLDILEQCLLEFPQNINQFSFNGTLTLHRNDLNYLSMKVTKLRETGETMLNPPWPDPDYYSVVGWPWQCYSPEKIKTYAETFYKTALDEYQTLISIWFPKFADRLRTAAILPANLVGVITPSYNKSDLSLKWHFEVLPYGEQSTVTFRFDEQDVLSNNAYTALNDQLNERLRLHRPQVYNWIGATSFHWSDLEIFQPNSATKLIYNWLWDDLKRVNWVE
jgi:hypothetical protein